MKSPGIHPTAIVSPNAKIGERVEIGPFAIVGEGCEIGDDCQIHPRATLDRDVKLGVGVKVGIGSVLGGPPQDLKYAGEQTTVEIGDGTIIREYVTVNRGTSQSFKTTVGSRCLLMSYVHLAHDCHLGNGVILGNAVQLAGHVIIDDRATLSGLSGVHQFVRIGRHAFIGGCSRVSKDIPPFL
jgi:UDP-N-acetylglucosamine acyltransferase